MSQDDNDFKTLEQVFLDSPFVKEIGVPVMLLVALLISLYCISHC
jgi:hypothetical protein